MVGVQSAECSDAANGEAGLGNLSWFLRRLLDQSPIGFNANDTNLHRYVGNNPTNLTDPSGLVAQGQKPKVPDTYTIPPEVKVAITTAWKSSIEIKSVKIGDEIITGELATEQGGTIVKMKDGKVRIKRALNAEEGAIPVTGYFLPGKDEVVIGTLHTHPYSKKDGSHERVPHSFNDFALLVKSQRGEVNAAGAPAGRGLTDFGDVMYVGSGSGIFVLVVVDAELAKKVRLPSLQELYTRVFKATRGQIPEKAETALKAILPDTGIVLYKAEEEGGWFRKIPNIAKKVDLRPMKK